VFEIKDILSIAIGTALGGVISWYVTHLYWQKSKATESIAKELRQLNQSIFSGLRSFVVLDRNPQYFNAGARDCEVTPSYESSKFDFPQVEWCKVPSGAKAGNPIKLLLKIVDLGLNFENPQGATITDHKSHVLEVESAGFGCLFATLYTSLDEAGRKITLNIRLEDTPEDNQTAKCTQQKISFHLT
jgi:hypothetical protein